MQTIEGSNMQVKLSRFPRTLKKKLRIPMNIFIGNIDIYHGPFDSVQPAMGCRKIVTIHDLRYFDFYDRLHDVLPIIKNYPQISESYDGWEQWMKGMRKRTFMAVQAADHIITVSRFTRDSLLKHLGVKHKSVHVVYNGISPIFRPIHEKEKKLRIKREYGIEGNYFLYVGHLDPLKNILKMIDAYLSVKSCIKGGTPYKLVVVTPTPKSYWFYYIILQRIKRLSVSGDIHFIHNPADEKLPFLYSGATAFLLPSLYEGFGLTPLEAMACGTPAIVSDVCSLPEVVGDAALLVNPYSTDSIAGAIQRVVSDRKLREELTQLGLERAKRFSWEKTARETLNVYRAAANR
jgi:glycosyltransferase involved in cell wall biosynthesis